MANNYDNNPNTPPATSGLGQMLLQQGGSAKDIIHEMASASTKIEEFLPKAILTKTEAKAILRYHWNSAYLTQDEEQEPVMDEIVWMDVISTPAIEGRAREDIVEMVTGKPRGFMGGMLNGMFGGRSRKRDMNKQEFSDL